MADTYKLNEKPTQPSKPEELEDYKLGVPPAPEGEEPITLVPPQQSVDKLFSDTYQYLLNAGHEPSVVDSLLAPAGSVSPSFKNNIYKELTPVFERNMHGVEETMKLTQSLAEDGIAFTPDQTTTLGELLSHFDDEAIRGVSEANQWYRRTKRQLSDYGAEQVGKGALNLSLGLSMLDIIDQFDKGGAVPRWGRINGFPVIGIPGKMDALRLPVGKKVSEQEMRDLEERVMPSITLEGLDGPRDFKTGVAAGLWIQAQRAQGVAEHLSSLGAEAGAAVVGSQRKLAELVGLVSAEQTFAGQEAYLRDIAARTEERGSQRIGQAYGQISALSSSLGTPSTQIGGGLSWWDIAERKLGLEQVMDDTLVRLTHSKGPGEAALKGVAMGTIATAAGMYDTIFTPSMAVIPLIDKIPTMGVKALRAVAGSEAIGKAATESATTNQRILNVMSAVEDTKKAFAEVDGKVAKAVSDSVRETGKPQVPTDLYKRWWTARRNMHTVESQLQSLKDASVDDILMRAPRRNPKLLSKPASEVEIDRALEGLRDVADDPSIRLELHNERLGTLERGQSQPVPLMPKDYASYTQRKVLGPDDSEYIGDALEMMLKTGGLAVDDVTIPSTLSPYYRVTPAAGPLQFLDWSNMPALKTRAATERRFLETVSGKGLPEYPGQKMFDLAHSTENLLVVQEDIIRRNLGVARATKQTDKISLYSRLLKNIRKVRGELDAESLAKANETFEDWFPQDMNPIMEDPGRLNAWFEKANNFVARSVYPGALHTGYWDTLAGHLHLGAREPQRFFEVLHPKAWEEFRSAMLREYQSQLAYDDRLRQTYEKAGVITRRSKFNPNRYASKYKVSKAKAAQLYDLLNTQEDTAKLSRLYKAASPDMREAHDTIREMMNTAADLYGLPKTGAVRYLEGYMPHFLDKKIMANGARAPELDGFPKNVQLFVAHLKERKGLATTNKDVVAALDIYGRLMHRKLIREPALQRLAEVGEELGQINPMYKHYVQGFISQLRGEPSILGKVLDDTIGATMRHFGKDWNPTTIDRQLTGISGLMHMSMLGGNPRYPFMQIATAIPTTAGRFGLGRTLGGIVRMATREGQALAKAAGVYKPFIDILESPSWKRLSAFVFEKLPTIWGISNGQAEMGIRSMTFWTALDAYMTKAGFSTWAEAVEAGMGRRMAFEALRASEEVNHIFGPFGRAPAPSRFFGRGPTVMATQFMSFMWKQSEELLSQAAQHPSHLMNYLAVSGLIAHMAARDWGIDATKYVGLGYLPTEPTDMTSPAIDALFSLVNAASAYNMHDPEEIARANSKLIDGVTNLAPLKVMFTSFMRAGERVQTGELRNWKGELMREMDFARAEGLEKLRPTGGPSPGIGGEAIPTLFMQKNLKEELYRRTKQQLVQENKRFVFNMRKALDDFIDATETGNEAAAEELAAKLEDTYKIRITATTPLERANQARSISWTLRFILPEFGGSEKMLDINLEVLRRNGVGLEGEQ